MRFQFTLGQQFLRDGGELFGEFKVGRDRGDLGPSEFECFAEDGVHQGPRRLDVVPGELHRQDRPVDTAGLGAERVGTKLGRVGLGDGVPGVFQLVAGQRADLFGALGVVVIESLGGPERLDVVKVARGTGRYDFVS